MRNQTVNQKWVNRPPHMLIEYIRDDYRNKIGVVVALDKNKVGWSVCKVANGQQLDRFNKEFGLKVAIGRAEKQSTATIPSQYAYEAVQKMYERAERYYKVSPTEAEEYIKELGEVNSGINEPKDFFKARRTW